MALRFNPPPNWPAPPDGFVPPAGWQPDPATVEAFLRASLNKGFTRE